MSTLRRLYGPAVSAKTWRATGHLLGDLPVGILWFTVVVTLLSTSAGLMVTFIGLPLLALTVLMGRGIAASERGRANLLVDADVHPYPKLPPVQGWWARTKRALGDGPGWMGLLYGLLMLPGGIVTFTIAITVWSIALSTVTFPIYAWIIDAAIAGDDGPFRFNDTYVLHGWGRAGYTVGVFVVGLVFLAITPRVIAGLAAVDRALVRSMLAPSPTEVLTQRVEQLTVSRDASVDAAATELRRIERDLHDGAQQRLVSLAMNLGIANDRLAAGADPETAAELVGRAHEDAKQAIVEIRDLVRGIHPAVLADRGLDAAISAIAARSPIPVAVDVRLDERPPERTEAAAYFVVAEALGNIAKHAGATRASVRIERLGHRLLVDVRDDGHGGAVEAPGGGLAGLRDRITGLEGTLRITSPAGGPTELHAELPC